MINTSLFKLIGSACPRLFSNLLKSPLLALGRIFTMFNLTVRWSIFVSKIVMQVCYIVYHRIMWKKRISIVLVIRSQVLCCKFPKWRGLAQNKRITTNSTNPCFILATFRTCLFSPFSSLMMKKLSYKYYNKRIRTRDKHVRNVARIKHGFVELVAILLL